MRSKRVVKATLACILSALLVSSVGLPAIAVDTGSAGGTMGFGSYASATDNNSNAKCGVLRIQLSTLASDSPVSDMATVNGRYSDFYEYPLFMMSGTTTSSSDSAAISHHTTFNTSTISADMSAEYKKWNVSTYKGSRYDAQWYVSGEGKYIHYTSSVSDTIFLEDILGVVKEKATAQDKKDFWYFYTTMASVVDKDSDFMYESNTTSYLGTTLNSVMQRIYADENKLKQFKRGYAVAMRYAYGNNSTALNRLFNSHASVLESIEDKSAFNPKYNSFLFERLQTFHSSALYAPEHMKSSAEYDTYGIGTSPDNNFSMSVSSYLSLGAKATGKPCSLDNYLLYENIEDNYAKGYSPFYSTWIGPVTSRMMDCLYPTKKYGGSYLPFNSDGNSCSASLRCFGGWAYFAFGEEPTDYKLFLQNPDVAQVATEITYNAYLKGEGDTDYKSESNTFGDNGHVMTDTVYLSKISDEVFGKGDPLINTVNTSITLSTPIKDYLYSLTSLKYRITDASGNTVIIDSDKTVGLSDVSSGSVVTELSDLKMAKTIAEDSNSGDKYTSLLYRDKKEMTGTNISSNSVPLYVYSGGKYVNTGVVTKGITSTAISGIEIKYGISFGYSDSDTKENSTKYLYVKNTDTSEYSPLVYESGTWYYCPIVKYTNLLVQIQADYVATYKKDDGIFNTVDMAEYLLSKNNNTSDFLNKSTTMYSMVDNLVTDVWGSLTSKSFTYKDASGTSTSYPLTDGGDGDGIAKYKFGSNVLIGESGDKLGWISGAGIVRDNYTTVYSQDYDLFGRYTNNAYIRVLEKSAPVLTYDVNMYDESSDKADSNKKVYRYLTTDVFKFNEDGSSRSTLDSALSKYQGYTGGTNSDGTTKVIEIAKSGATTGEFPAETRINRGASNALTGVKLDKTKIGSVVGYKESTFTKLLTTYSAMTYTKRSDASSSSAVPKAVSWNIGVQTDTNGSNATALGLDTSSSATLLKAVLGDYTGFVRFGKTEYSNGELFNRQNKEGYNASTGVVRFSPDILVTNKNPDLTESRNATFFAPFSQNSIDVPLTYNFNVYTPKILTTPSVTSSTPISTGSTVTQSTSTSSVLKVYPEVTMWGEDKQTSSTATKSYTPVITVGQRQREIPIVAYNKLSLLGSDVVPTISSTAIALDTRAKALSTRLTGYDNVPVVYSGSQINLSYESTGVGTVKSYILDIVDSTLKSTWGNTPIAPKSVMTTYLSKFKSTVEPIVSIRNTDTSTDKEISFGEVTGDINLSGDPRETGSWLLAVKGGVVKSVSYNGKTYTVSNASSTSSLKVTNSSGSVDSTCKLIREVLLGTKVCGDNNVLAKCFETNGGKSVDASLSTWLTGNADALDDRSATGGWYYEDTSVLCIKEYTGNFNLPAAIANEQIPINLGPVTPANKNNYFSNGYPATVCINYKLGVTNGSTFTGITGEMHSNKADFIISDVTINDATTY